MNQVMSETMSMSSRTDMFSNTLPFILCCMCGTSIQTNPSNMCVSCLKNSYDISGGISRQLTIHSCRSCQRFLCPPWQKVQLESKELMAACLRKIPGLNKVKLVDAVWIWTEPHSMRIKMKITVQKEVVSGTILQQAIVVEFVIRNQQCKDCEKSYTEAGWHAVVQIRQRVSHKRTFYYLEQLLLKYKAHTDAINIVIFRDGMDFYFMDRQHAMRFIDFLTGHIPIKTKLSRKLVSADHTSNKANFKNNYIVEIVPICKDDLLVLPKELAKNLANISPLVLVKAVNADIHVVDPITGERGEINTEKYWRYEFAAKMNSRQLVRFVVLSIEPVIQESRPSSKKRGVDRKMRLAEVVIAKESDFGVRDIQYTCITHLGHILHEGDIALGYDISNAPWLGDDEYPRSLTANFPDVILVRKHYPTKGERFWSLKNIESAEMEVESAKEKSTVDDDYEEFLQEVAGDKEMRENMNIYKAAKYSKKSKAKADMRSDVKSEANDMAMDSDEEAIRLDELLDELELSDELESAAILSPEQSAAVPSINLPSTGFDINDVNMNDFKFK